MVVCVRMSVRSRQCEKRVIGSPVPWLQTDGQVERMETRWKEGLMEEGKKRMQKVDKTALLCLWGA